MTRPAARNWRDQAAHAAAADVERASEAEAIEQARKLADWGRQGAAAGLVVLAVLGAALGWTTTAVQLRPDEGSVNAALALLVIAGGPWICRLCVYGFLRLVFPREASPVLGRLVKTGLECAAGWDAETRDPAAAIARRIRDMLTRRDAGARDLAAATAHRIKDMLGAGNGQCLAAVGSGTFWMAYAGGAVAAIWIGTAHITLGFGWESSWISPSFGQTVIELAAMPLAPLISSDELTPIAAAPARLADDPAALAARRVWLLFLTAGVAMYLLLPMAAWTLLQAVRGYWRALHRQLTDAVVARSTAAAAAFPSGSVGPPPCTHVVRLKRPTWVGGRPAPLDRLDDRGSVDAAANLKRMRDIVHAGPARVAIVGWLPAKPDRAVRRRLRTLVDASHHAPLLVLDGGDALRRAEPARTAAVRLEDWRTLARDTGVDPFECDLAELTDASRRRLAGAIDRQAALTPAGLDPAPLDDAFDVIEQHLECDDPLPSDAALVSCLAEVARTFHADAGGESRTAAWSARLAALRSLDQSDASGLAASLAATGGGLLSLARRGVGLLSFARRGGGQPGSPPADAAPDGPQRLGEAVFAAAAAAVLWWSQGADEARTTRALEALAPDDIVPALDDPDGARRWLATARDRVLAAAGREA